MNIVVWANIVKVNYLNGIIKYLCQWKVARTSYSFPQWESQSETCKKLGWILTVPGSNACVEKVIAVINVMRTDERNRSSKSTR